jgi:hypothetical protein
MGAARLVGVLAILLALAGGGLALAAWNRDAPSSGVASYPVEVVGPEGVLFQGTVRVENATALSALEAAAAHAGLGLKVQRYPGMGSYVRAIGPYEAAGASGWTYEVKRGDAWTTGDRSAEYFPLAPGDALRWRWTGDA